MHSPLAEHHVNTTEPLGAAWAGRRSRRNRRISTLQHPNCVYQIMRRHYARYTPEMVEQATGCPQRGLPEGLRGADAQFGTRAHGRLLLRGRMDASQHGRADHPRRDDHPGSARQYRPAGRRHPGLARSLQHSGQHGYPDALQHAAHLSAAAECASSRIITLKDFLKAETVPTGWWHNLPEIHGEPADGLVRRGGNQRQRMGLRLHPEADRRPFAAAHDAWRWRTAS